MARTSLPRLYLFFTDTLYSTGQKYYSTVLYCTIIDSNSTGIGLDIMPRMIIAL